jgi:hypothetical protein
MVFALNLSPVDPRDRNILYKLSILFRIMFIVRQLWDHSLREGTCPNRVIVFNNVLNDYGLSRELCFNKVKPIDINSVGMCIMVSVF